MELYKTAIYCRLSQDDKMEGDSSSIQTQKMMLENYANENGYIINDFYVDDGYSGLNFNRPAFQRMLNDIDEGKINLVLTKDLSRLGRDYIMTGYYTEIYFSDKGVRYIAVNDGIDTNKDNNDIAPFKNILNDMYAKDISRKIKSAKRQRMYKGMFVASQAPYGYKPNPLNKNQLIIDEEASKVVKEIFRLALTNIGVVKIVRELNNRKIKSPSVYKAESGDIRFIKLVETRKRLYKNYDIENWNTVTVGKILRDIVYIGDMENHKFEVKNYKTKRLTKVPKEEHIIVRNTHEAIIEYEDFYKVQDLIKNRQRPCKYDFQNLFKGIVKCENCGRTLTIAYHKRRNGNKVYELRCMGICLSIIMDTKLDNQAFEKMDVYNLPYCVVLNPKTIDDIYQFSYVGKAIQIPRFTTNYFKFSLEKGQYGFYANRLGTGNGFSYGSQMDIKLYNENQEEVSVGMGIKSNPYANDFPQKTFYINKSGIYYLCVKSKDSEDTEVRLNQLDYETIGFESVQEFISGKGIIEGEYDFDLFTTNGQKGEAILFKNTGQNPIPIYYKDKKSYSHLEIITDEKVIELQEGENKFIICSDFVYYTAPFEYEFTTQKYLLENGYEENYEDLKKVTIEFSDLTYVIGNSLPNPRLAFEVDKKSIIDFRFLTNVASQSEICAIVKDLKGNEYTPITGNIYELDPGKYIVEIDSSYVFAECQVKYNVTEIEDKEIDVTLEEGNLSSLSSFPTIKAQNVGSTQKVKYNFILSEDTLISFEMGIKLFQKDGTPVFYFGPENYYKTIYLPQGAYYFLIEGEGSYYNPSREYKFGIVVDDFDTVFTIDRIKEIEVGQELVLKRDWEYDVEYLVFRTQEDGQYQFSHIMSIYNENFRLITETNFEESTELRAGVYYLIFNHSNFSTEDNNEVSILIK